MSLAFPLQLFVVGGVMLSSSTLATAADAPPAELPPIEVRPGEDWLSESDRQLGQLRQGLPGFGHEGPAPLSRGERFMNWLLMPRDLDEASELQRHLADHLDDPDAHLRKGR
jgi:hypothetical protein